MATVTPATNPSSSPPLPPPSPHSPRAHYHAQDVVSPAVMTSTKRTGEHERLTAFARAHGASMHGNGACGTHRIRKTARTRGAVSGALRTARTEV